MRFTRDLKPGDLIVVSYNHYLIHAIFLKYGKSGNYHFVSLQLEKGHWENSNVVQRILKGRFVDYINRRSIQQVVAKIDPSVLGDEDRDTYFGILNLLKQKKIIV